MKKYGVLLADADGTLLDFSKAEDRALKAACEAMGIAIGQAQAEQYKAINEALWKAFERGEVTQDALRVLRFERFLQALGSDGDAAEMGEHFVRALSLQTDEIDGALAFLRAASARVPVVIVTNGIASVQRSRLSLSPLRAYTAGHVISGELGFAKPDARMIQAALDIVQAAPQDALMLGDSLTSDIAAAHNAGVDSCWFNPQGLPNPGPLAPTYTVAHLREVLQWL